MSSCIFAGLNAELSAVSKLDATVYEVESSGEKLRYAISNDVISTYSRTTDPKWKLSESDKLKILNKILSLNEIGVAPLFVWDKKLLPEMTEVQALEIEEIRKSEIDHKYKEDEILKLLSKKLTDESPFALIGFHQFDLYRLKIFDAKELYRWLISLEGKDLIKFMIPQPTLVDRGPRFIIPLEHYRNNLLVPNLVEITPRGWEKLYNDSRPSVTRNAFIAMAFTDVDGKLLPEDTRETIKNACEELGWNPLIVDEVGHNDGVMDKIISLINESRYVVADLTHHKSGVYYEAGYAKSKGIEVIHTVHASDFNRCHFDVKHLNLIIYKDQTELFEKLKNRVNSTVGPFKEVR